MHNIVLQSEQTTHMHLDRSAVNVNVNLAGERLDGKPACRAVLVQPTSSFQRNQNNTQVWILGDCVRGVLGLPRLLRKQPFNLLREIEGQ